MDVIGKEHSFEEVQAAFEQHAERQTGDTFESFVSNNYWTHTIGGKTRYTKREPSPPSSILSSALYGGSGW